MTLAVTQPSFRSQMWYPHDPDLVLGSKDGRRREFMAAAALGFFREHRDDNQHT
jgi:hypothetical protein